jgi:hypothetical protein
MKHAKNGLDLSHAISVRRVHHENDAMAFCIITGPDTLQIGLATKVPKIDSCRPWSAICHPWTDIDPADYYREFRDYLIVYRVKWNYYLIQSWA